MISMLSAICEVCGRVDAGKCAEIAYKMSLVKISAFQSYGRPLDSLPHPDMTQHFLKSPDAAKQLWRQPNLFVENLNKTPRAQTDLFGQARYCLCVRHALEFFQCISDRRMPLQWPHCLRYQRPFEDLEFYLRRCRFDRLIAQVSRRRAP